MSEVLARIRVRETHGIRRFLYPLTASIELPEFNHVTYGNLDTSKWSLTFAEGEPVPFQVQHEGGGGPYSINFAVSLEPYGEISLNLQRTGPQCFLDDPLSIAKAMDAVGPFVNTQKQFSVAFAYGKIYRIKYDGAEHLREPSKIALNGTELVVCDPVFPPDEETITVRTYGSLCLGTQDGQRWAYPGLEITACKSWVMTSYLLQRVQPNDEVVFTLPLAVTSPSLTCDFGVGGGIYGKLNAETSPEVVWRTELGDAPYARWSVATAGRTDYVGTVETAEAFLPQRWFHLIDSDKSLAVAITKVPDSCGEMTVRLTHEGDVTIAFRLGETVTGSAEFGVCYHFLNDVPAIAAATNPQSILLPPVVEVLPI